jgi:hypothetical protein
VTVVKIQMQERKIIILNVVSNSSIRLVLSKNRNRDKLAFKKRQNLHSADNSLILNQRNTTQKKTKILQSAHKLHSLHRSYNKA